MTSKIKTLGIAFFAVVAMSAVAASAAQAGAIDLGNGKTKATITGHSDVKAGGGFQEHSLTIPLPAGGFIHVKCPTASFEGTASSPDGKDITDVQLTATYGKGPLDSETCKFNGLAAHVNMNGCKYTLTGAGLPAGTFNVDITGCTVGTPGIVIQDTATGCLVTIPEQHNLAHIVLKAHGPLLQTATAEATVGGITNKQDAACPQPNTHAQNASFVGNTTVEAFEDQGSQQVTKHGHQYTQFTHNGIEVPIIIT